MSTHVFRLNLTSAAFPLLSRYGGRSIYTRGRTDTNYVVSNGYSGTYADRDMGIPMPIYMENVLPTTYGFKAVGYAEHKSKTSNPYFNTCFSLRSSKENTYLFSPAQGKNYISKSGQNTWQSFPFATAIAGQVTVAYIHQKTYVCYARNGVYEYDETTDTFNQVVLTGITANKLEGITSANNYMVAWTQDTVYWSSPLSSLDFTPSLSTAAGSEQVNAVKGKIVACTPIADGFIIYTTSNAVTARYTGNDKFLWNFVEVAGSSGITSIEHVAYDSNAELHYNWATTGLFLTDLRSPKGATSVQFMPEISDFLLDTLQEEYVGNNNNLSVTNVSEVWSGETQSYPGYTVGENNLVEYRLGNKPQVKLAHIANRYLCISYSAKNSAVFSYCLVFDTALKRLGKLKIEHTDCFESTQATGDLFNAIGFLQKDGAILTVNSSTVSSFNSVFLFGKVQHSKEKMLTLFGVEVENATDTNSQLSILTSLDGKNFLPDKHPLPTILTKNLQKYQCRITGINHSFKITGDFHLVSLQGTATTYGDR
jgi:hypothetical protein